MENRGNVKMRMSSGRLRVFQLIPLPTNIEEALSKGLYPVEAHKHRATWSKLKEKGLKWNPNIDYIEPNETAEYHYDFFIDSDSEVVQIRSHVVDRRITRLGISCKKQLPWLHLGLKRTQIGWNTISLHDLRAREEEVEGSKARGYLPTIL
jgi:hypothetical protein